MGYSQDTSEVEYFYACFSARIQFVLLLGGRAYKPCLPNWSLASSL